MTTTAFTLFCGFTWTQTVRLVKTSTSQLQKCISQCLPESHSKIFHHCFQRPSLVRIINHGSRHLIEANYFYYSACNTSFANLNVRGEKSYLSRLLFSTAVLAPVSTKISERGSIGRYLEESRGRKQPRLFLARLWTPDITMHQKGKRQKVRQINTRAQDGRLPLSLATGNSRELIHERTVRPFLPPVLCPFINVAPFLGHFPREPCD